jgi:hypothetical protein
MKKLVVLSILFISISSFSQNVLDYYKEIAYKAEYTVNNDTSSFHPRRWKKDIKIFVKGAPDSIVCSELYKVVSELNSLIETIDIKITDNESEANLIAFFGWFLEYDKLEPNAVRFTGGNHGLACVYPGADNDLIRGSFYVDVVRCNWFPEEQAVILKKHLVREELTQSLGLLNDSMKYPESIFYQGFSYPTEFSKLDIEIIKMHYN